MYQVESSYRTFTKTPASWLAEKLGQVLFMALVALYSTVALSLQFCVFLLKRAPGFLLVVTFYASLAIFGIVISLIVSSYLLLALIGNINIP